MTSDAKIGLLLGLVFIFVIAFIINGLPNLRPQTTRAEVPTNMVNMTEQDISIGGKAQVQVDQDRQGLVDSQETTAKEPQTAVEQPTSTVEQPTEQVQTANNQEVRFESPLPRFENLLKRFTDVAAATLQSQQEQTSTVNMDVPSAASTEQPAATGPQPVVQIPASRTGDTVARSVEQLKPATTTPAKPAGKIYVVGDGESLSTVAKKVYGPEEGNRIVNVNRIYEANKDVLKSVHEVIAGQKLVIPPLPKSTVNPNKPSDVLPAELFERLEPLRKPAAAQTPAPSVAARWYTVQDGDNLWKIARTQLGAGARYEEIAKLNADLLKDKPNLDLGVGMKIRLPLK